MIFLDTHVVVWLYSGMTELISDVALDLVRDNAIMISPVVLLELGYLHEIGRIRVGASEMVEDLAERIGLTPCSRDFLSVVRSSLGITWTRDPFDRIITGHAALSESILVTKDTTILSNYSLARW